jgi:hypothetical protein
MKKSLLSLLGLALALQSQAQLDKTDEVEKNLKRKVEAKNEGWTRGGLLNIGLTQGLLENWAAGGERMSMAINGQFNGFAARVKGNKVLEGTVDLYYGLNYVESNAFKPRKLDDRIDASIRYGVQPKNWTVSKSKIKRNLYLTGLFRFQSQFSKGFDYAQAGWENAPISEFMSPAFFTLALGAEYRPSENFSVFFSPFASKLTTVKSKYTQFGTAFGVPQGKTARLELGAYLSARYKTNISKNILYTTRLDLYSNYLAKNTQMAAGYIRKDNPGNIDILWDNFFAIKISKFIGAGIGFTTVYDNDQPGKFTRSSGLKNPDGTLVMDKYGPLGWTQLKQVFNLGFSYKL